MKDRDNSDSCVVAAEELWAMKRRQQARDLALAASGKRPAEAVLLLRPDRLRGARIEWPEADLVDKNDGR